MQVRCFWLFDRHRRFAALKIVKSAQHYTETAVDEIKLLSAVSIKCCKFITPLQYIFWYNTKHRCQMWINFQHGLIWSKNCCNTFVIMLQEWLLLSKVVSMLKSIVESGQTWRWKSSFWCVLNLIQLSKVVLFVSRFCTIEMARNNLEGFHSVWKYLNCQVSLKFPLTVCSQCICFVTELTEWGRCKSGTETVKPVCSSDSILT